VRRSLERAFLLLVLCGLAPSAPAASTSFISAFSGSGFDAIGVTPFDPALGTLDSVQVSIDGTLTVSGQTPPQIFTIGFSNVPFPYSYSVSVTQDFFGLIGKYFDFDSNARFGFSGVATGLPAPFAFATDFSYDFSFTATTDLLGFTVPVASSSSGVFVPPTSISGTRSDFLETIVPIDEVDLVQTWSSQTAGAIFPTVQIDSVHAGGTITLLYNYTPPIPEPQTYATLLAGLGLLGFAARRRRLVRESLYSRSPRG
jgi:hypothetical protein